MRDNMIPSIILIFIFVALASIKAHAGILAASTRVIYLEGVHEKSLMLANTNGYSVLAQTWMDDGLGDPQKANAPFVVMPSVFQLSPKDIRGIRIVYTGDNLPKDRESVFWLNLYEIAKVKKKPVEENQTKIDLAMDTQVKVFYRPKTLTLKSEDIAEKLSFTLQQDKDQWFLVCNNPTPYHASFTSLQFLSGNQLLTVRQEMDMMTKPFSQRRYVLDGIIKQQTPQDRIKFYLIGDDGFQNLKEAILSSH